MSARTVAFLDILGFRKLVESTPIDELGVRFTSIVGRLLPAMNRKFGEFPDQPTFFPQQTAGEPWCIRYVFSDSIILISHDKSEDSALALLIHSMRVRQALIASKLPVRGAVAHGDMYVDTTNSLFLGKALTRAYELEQRQNWIGVAIDESVPDAFPSLLVSDTPVAGLRANLFPRYEVPMKSGPIQPLYTVNWRWNMVAEDGTRALFNDDGDWSAKVKIDAALAYALEMRKSGRAYPVNHETVPIEVRPLFIAAGPPRDKPPRHGDQY